MNNLQINTMKNKNKIQHCWNNSGAGTAYPSGEPEFIPVFSGVCVTRSLVFCVMFCR